MQKSIDSAKNEGAEYIIVLGHLGNKYGSKPYTYADVISNTSGIDVLLDGHSHDIEKVVMKDKEGNSVLRLACGTKMANIGWLKISNNIIDGGLYTWNEESQNINKENKIQKSVNKKMEKLKQKLSEKIGYAKAELTINDPTEVDSAGNPIRIIRRMETNLGDLCADAFRYAGKADIAIINGGGIRTSIKKGDITLGDIYKTFPFENKLCVMEVTGQQILDALEWGAKSVPHEDGGFLQVSGITYEIHTDIDSSCTYDENKIFKSVEGEYRVKNVMVGDEPLDLNKTYILASISYVLKLDGDGQSAFKNCKILNDEIELDSQVLINYIKEKLNGNIENMYEDAYGEGRIIII